jgi:hypothetical protein
MGKQKENDRNTQGKPLENYRKPRGNRWKAIGKLWKNDRTTTIIP